MKITLSLQPTTNRQYGMHGQIKYLTHESRTWKEETLWKLKTLRLVTLLDKVVVTVHFYLKFDRDVDNLKLLLDTLTGQVYEDDKQVVELHVYKHKDKLNPRVVVEVLPLDNKH